MPSLRYWVTVPSAVIPMLRPADSRPSVEYIQDIDDWLAIIVTGRNIGITAEGTVTQYRRDGIVYRPLRDAEPIAVRLIWRRHDPHPATYAAIALLSDLYRRQSSGYPPM